VAEYLSKVVSQIAEFFGSLSLSRKIGLIATSVGVIVGVGLIFIWAGKENYQPLMTNLNPEDSSAVMRFLRQKNIPFRLEPGGKTISVPPESIHELRLEIATLGLPESSVVGYELFDQQTVGTTSFVQKVNRKRALEGELMRTISKMNGVRRARVHLAMPKESTFIEDHKDPKASVFVDLNPGIQLKEKQIFGIGNLVASAVEGLDVENVVIVDQNGKTLSKNVHDSTVAMTASQLDYQKSVEREMERRVETLLEPIIGEGKVVARVTADIDFSRISETQTLYDPEGSAVRSVQKNNQNMQGRRPGPYGRPGAATNTPGEVPPENTDITQSTTKDKETVNYDIPKTVRHTTHSTGGVKRLSVAVVLDGKKEMEKSESGEVLAKVVPWTPEKIAEFESIVAQAVGLNPKRGDSLEIKNMEFTRQDFAEAERLLQEAERRAYYRNLMVYLIIGTIIVLFFVFVVRPFIKWITENTVDTVDTFLPQTIEELERMQASTGLPGMEDVVPDLPEKIDPEKIEGEMIKEKVTTLIDANPQKAALVLREWVRNEGRPKKDAEATAE
jgi:flagellar M-ring protein FliF